MVCGATSGAGKSFLATAMARWYARQGIKVAPFKAQNMSNNARVVADGEIGSAQYFQAIAARVMPDVRMNPVLLKPERDTASQVILLGQRNDELSRMEWRSRSAMLWPIICDSLGSLRASHDLVIIEGAGSPAEINLQSSDIVNMRVAAEADAATLVICDIDRGGAFAHLYGTYQLLEPAHQALIKGFVLNKFRGDPGLLAPGPEQLMELTGVPTLGVLPLWRGHGLPEEDGVFDAYGSGSGLRVVIAAYPRISNLDEFAPLQRVPGLSVSWAREARTIAGADLLILPGSKNVAEDLAWLRQTGLAQAIGTHIQADKPTLAVCGGLQMLGGDLLDPHGVEGASSGLGLLPLVTEMQAAKRCRRGSYTLGVLRHFWAPLSGVRFDAYEIRHGHTRVSNEDGNAAATRTATLHSVLADGCGWQRGQTLALYTHGLFENSAVMHALFGVNCPTLDDTLDGLADFIDEHIGATTLNSLLDARV
jgi:adenosylcobyric acid synthase